MFGLLDTYMRYDPAARSKWEVFFLYPGVKAVFAHRLAHQLYDWRIPFLPRMISELSRFFTGIEIHPGAQIGKNVIIDHGMGTVIGETAIVGDFVILYQGVTLGGTSTQKQKRHPTLETGVVVGAGAKILGNITIGHHSRVGANSVVIDHVPPCCTVVGIPGRVIPQAVETGTELEHGKI
ncbi:MAG: serine O-acetyltransferase [Proteobacteria bacterium]|nr:serine O-acetyltransferase [Pseudomonadota bacterium]NDC23648.1 serine O-acetyltransferase [Pseudomonadota bacterium]NDD03578.1 serine O-acetyltransferase [Pseudomonadota bacterium]NDG25890.1 serine O-acetyltransferase [Pseudomonadota bacterium]